MEMYQKEDGEDIINAGTQTEIFLIPVIHEKVSVEKKLVETSKIKITKKIVEEHLSLPITLVHEEIDVKFVPVNEFVDNLPEPIRYEGDTMIISVLKEVSVIRVMLEQEIHITKKKVQTNDSQPVLLKKEEVTIEKIPLAGKQGMV